MGEICLGSDEYTRGVFVEPMHDAGTLYPTDSGELTAVRQQRVDKCSRIDPSGGVDNHTGGFVYNNQAGIFVQNIKRDWFGLGFFQGAGFGESESDLIAGSEFVTGLAHFAVDRYMAIADQFLNVRSGQLI
jgi:hypothetical protein